MRHLFRFIIFFALLCAAVASYSYGHKTGLFVFVVLGFAFEAAFWLGLFPLKRDKGQTS